MATDAAWQQAKEDFDRDGVAVVRGFFAGADRDKWLGEIDRYIREVAPTLDPKRVFYEDKTRPETLLRAEKMHEFDDYFLALKDSGRCLEFAQLMLDGPVEPRTAEIMGKAPRIGQPTPPHQDARYWHISPNDALTMWIAIDPVDQENGCVRYVKGSHLQPMRPHLKSDQIGFSQKLTDYSEADERNAIAVSLEPGDMVVHHCMTIHRADANPTDRMRRGFRLVYYAEHVVTDQKAAKEYGEKLKQEWANAGKL